MKQIKFLSLTILFALFANLLFANNIPSPSELVKQYFAAVDAGNAAELDKLLAADFSSSTPMSAQPMNKQMWAGTMQAFKTAFPDMKHEISNAVEQGFSVAVCGVFKGQNNGAMMGNPATGNRVAAPFNAFIEFDKSWKIKSINSQFDMKGFEAQLMAGLPDAAAAAEATVRAMLAAADEGNVDKFMGYWAADGINYFAGKQTSGDDMKKRIAAFKTAFPNIKRTLDEVAVSGNTITVRGWVTGTNSGNFRGQSPSGNAIKIAWLGFYKLNAAGKIQSGWVEFDTATLDAQVKGEMAGK